MRIDVVIKVVMIIFLAVLTVAMLTYIKGRGLTGEKCQSNPFVWGAGVMSERYEAGLDCQCIIMTMPAKTFYFTDKEFNPKNKLPKESPPEINLSIFDETK